MLSQRSISFRINERFDGGAPSNDIASAGIVTHMIDPSSDLDRPWLMCTADWCQQYADRLPATLLHPGARMFYTKRGDHSISSLTGLILHPDFVSILCAYPSDGSTMDRLCLGSDADSGSGCIPGCPNRWSEVEWCTEQQPWNCAWAADGLKNMMEEQVEGLKTASCNNIKCYNELVLDPRQFISMLPQAIEAMFYPTWASEDQIKFARAVRAGFVGLYELDADAFPLLEYDPDQKESPFTIVVKGPDEVTWS